MALAVPLPSVRSGPPANSWRSRGIYFVRIAMEIVLLALVAVAPWLLGSVHPISQFILLTGISVLLWMWSIRLLLDGQLTWRNCPVFLCLTGLFLLLLLQLVPLSESQLRQLAPATWRLQQALRPTQPELLEGETAQSSPPPFTLSLYPGGTRTAALRIVAVLALFAVVRNNLATRAHLRRLAIVALINGAFLSLFALVQFYTAPKHWVYWTYLTEGAVFGPFICRNHFPFYVNLCLGLGFGLLLAGTMSLTGRGRSRYGRPPFMESLREILNQPQLLWISGALALMLAANACSLSRGGFLAMLGGIIACLLLRGAAVQRWTSGTGVMVFALIGAMALVGWFGYGAVEDRMATLWKTDTPEEPRLSMGLRLLPLVPQHPIWGTGFGTFEQVEPITRTAGDPTKVIYDHAHDEYLEFLIEGGVPGLVLFLAAVGFVGYRGYRALRVASPTTAALALGCLFALTTLLLHSAVDFGLRIPAIVFLATVLSAMLVGLTDEPAAAAGTTPPGLMTFHLGGLAAPLGAVAVLAVALLLLRDGWRAHQAERYRKAAETCRFDPSGAGRVRQIRYLEAATQLAPDDAKLRVNLAQAYQDGFLALQEQRGAEPAAKYAPDVLQLQIDCTRNYRQARDLCPLLVEPEVKLAGPVAQAVLRQKDPPTAYLDRALILMPCDELVWFIAGQMEVAAGQLDEAADKWRHSLLCGPTYLPGIIARAADLQMAPGAFVDKVLPDQPELLYKAGKLAAAGEQADLAQACYERGLMILDARTDPGAEDLCTKGRLYRERKMPTEAIKVFEIAVARRSSEVEWHFELAELFLSQNRYADARKELSAVRNLSPGHEAARRLEDKIRLKQEASH